MQWLKKGLTDLNASFHSFMSRFRGCNASSKNKLFHQYCSSMYGSQMWALNSNGIDKICSRWRKYHRIVLEVPNTTHCDILPLIADRIPLICTLDLKFISFYISIATSDNTLMKYMAKNMLNIDTSTMGRNVRYICYKYGVSIDELLMFSIGKIKKEVYNKWISGINSEYLPYAHGIKHMIGIKEE